MSEYIVAKIWEQNSSRKGDIKKQRSIKQNLATQKHRQGTKLCTEQKNGENTGMQQ
jgi:hypothetical protein